MPLEIRVASPPPKPVLVYDGDCDFCCRWVARWQRATGDAVAYWPYQDERVAGQFPEIPQADFERAVHLILPGGLACAGAEAVLRALSEAGKERWLYWLYTRFSSFADAAELLYEEVADHRSFLSKIDRVYSGPGLAPLNYIRIRWLFLRGLALIYLVAFASLAGQIEGLSGSHGIVPVHALMEQLKTEMAVNHIGLGRYHLVPTLCWWNDSDRALQWQCNAGVGLSLLLLFGIAPAPALFLLWALYLSLTSVCSPFLNFQWDLLLLETGFLAIFFAPLQWLERPSRQSRPSGLVLWLLRWLIFRLMFESGVVKILSGDVSWTHLTALRVHYETQPLPTWIGWYAHQLPPGFQSFSVLVMFFIELVAPMFIFSGRRARITAAALFALFQIIILLTGNYTFFNYLTILLCLPLLDDESISWLWRRRVPTPVPEQLPETPPPRPRECPRWPRCVILPVTVVTAGTTTVMLLLTLWVPQRASVFTALAGWLEPFRSFNGYGLFRVMTQTRPEIIIEGSDDGEHWRPYEFKYKPGDLAARPRFVAPHQPRLDWQMWFAALSDPRQNPWFLNLEVRLLQNSPEVIALLAHNPFPNAPPKFIRAELYEYHFTDPAQRRATGDWWRRDYKGPYLPPLSLRQGGIQQRN